jgi:hypothetical protein
MIGRHYGLDTIQRGDPDQLAWPDHSCYLIYLKDTRNDNYWRSYVGQSSKYDQRIRQHYEAYIHQDKKTLHYLFIPKIDTFGL